MSLPACRRRLRPVRARRRVQARVPGGATQFPNISPCLLLTHVRSSQPLAVFLTVFSVLEYLMLRCTTHARRALTLKCNAPRWLIPSLEELANRNKRLLSDAVYAAHPAAFPADAAAGSSDPRVLSLLAVPSPAGDASTNYGAAATAASPWMAGPDCSSIHGLPVLTLCILLHDGLTQHPACWLIEHPHTLTLSSPFIPGMLRRERSSKLRHNILLPCLTRCERSSKLSHNGDWCLARGGGAGGGARRGAAAAVRHPRLGTAAAHPRAPGAPGAGRSRHTRRRHH